MGFLLKNLSGLLKFDFFVSFIFRGFSFEKLKRIKCCPLPYSLHSGSIANRTAREPEFAGGTGSTGGVAIKSSLYFLYIFRHIKYYTYICLVLKRQPIRTTFILVLSFGQVGGPDAKFQKHPLG